MYFILHENVVGTLQSTCRDRADIIIYNYIDLSQQSSFCKSPRNGQASALKEPYFSGLVEYL